MIKHLYIMRHGETLFNERRLIQGWCDSPLTKKGQAQAEAAGALIKDIVFDHYYTSTSERCCDTLEIATHQKDYIRLKGLKERYFGTFEGESEELNPPVEHFDHLFPLFGGETTAQVQKRILDTLTNIMEQEDHQCVLAVSHAGAIISFLLAIMPSEDFPSVLPLRNGSIVHCIYDGHFHVVDILRTGS